MAAAIMMFYGDSIIYDESKHKKSGRKTLDFIGSKDKLGGHTEIDLDNLVGGLPAYVVEHQQLREKYTIFRESGDNTNCCGEADDRGSVRSKCAKVIRKTPRWCHRVCFNFVRMGI